MQRGVKLTIFASHRIARIISWISRRNFPLDVISQMLALSIVKITFQPVLLSFDVNFYAVSFFWMEISITVWVLYINIRRNRGQVRGGSEFRLRSLLQGVKRKTERKWEKPNVFPLYLYFSPSALKQERSITSIRSPYLDLPIATRTRSPPQKKVNISSSGHLDRYSTTAHTNQDVSTTTRGHSPTKEQQK